jgi:hypothetical protein
MFQGEHLFQVLDSVGSACTIRFVDHKDVGNLHQPGLVGLHRISPAWVHDNHAGVSRANDFNLDLADSDGLNKHPRKPNGVEQANCSRGGQGESPEMTPSGHGSDDHSFIECLIAHADPITQDGTAREGRGRVNSENTDSIAVATQDPTQ